jgi:hypothetical protein
MTDFASHLIRQAAFGRATFGPGPRTEGVLKHIETEIEEVRKATSLDERANEWVDIAILGLDGLLRAVRERSELWHHPDIVTNDHVASVAVGMILKKQAKNELRDWPDWRTMSSDAPIEHDRENGVQ